MSNDFSGVLTTMPHLLLAGFIGGIVCYILLNGTGWVFDKLTQKGVPFIGPSEILLDRQVRLHVCTRCHGRPRVSA